MLARAKAYAPYADLIWVETGTPTSAWHANLPPSCTRDFPGKMLAYNCSPSFNWKASLDDRQIAEFQDRLGELGYRFQFITLAGFHALNHAMFSLARGYAQDGMTSYVALQQAEFADEPNGYTATRHQAEVGTGYFDKVRDCAQPAQRDDRAGRLNRDRPIPLIRTELPASALREQLPRDITER